MTLSNEELARVTRLRELFLDESRGAAALADYWRDDRDLSAYDEVLGARIGWKWDAVLAECLERGWARADGESVLDYGCGSGIAARQFVTACGAGQVLCHDRSARAMAFASRRLREQVPTIVARPLPELGDVRPDVLLVSHVLGELDAAGEAELRGLIARSRRVVIVEPGNRAISRRLSQLRDQLLAQFQIVAPCPHAAACPALAQANDWCHFFAPPSQRVFTDGDWVRNARALGIDTRALPYAFLALAREAAAAVPVAGPGRSLGRVLGRPEILPHSARLQVCEAPGLRVVELQKRHDKELWRRLKKHPEEVRGWPTVE